MHNLLSNKTFSLVIGGNGLILKNFKYSLSKEVPNKNYDAIIFVKQVNFASNF